MGRRSRKLEGTRIVQMIKDQRLRRRRTRFPPAHKQSRPVPRGDKARFDRPEFALLALRRAPRVAHEAIPRAHQAESADWQPAAFHRPARSPSAAGESRPPPQYRSLLEAVAVVAAALVWRGDPTAGKKG